MVIRNKTLRAVQAVLKTCHKHSISVTITIAGDGLVSGGWVAQRARQAGKKRGGSEYYAQIGRKGAQARAEKRVAKAAEMPELFADSTERLTLAEVQAIDEMTKGIPISATSGMTPRQLRAYGRMRKSGSEHDYALRIAKAVL